MEPGQSLTKDDDLARHGEEQRQRCEVEVDGQVGTGVVPAAHTPHANAQKASYAAKVRKQRQGDAVQDLSKMGGGVPLPEDVRRRMERKLGADFGKVRIHTDTPAQVEGADTRGVTIGDQIYFREPGDIHDERLLAHELAHVVQNGAAPARGEVRLGERGDGAEHEADKVADAVTSGKEVPAITPGQDPGTARRFGAGVHGHGGIESEAASGSKELDPNDPRKEGVSEIYSGNFMRDMNQLNVPKVIEGLEGLPKDVTSPKGAKIGAKGAHDVTSAIIQALAIIELGPKAAGLVTGGENGTADHIGAYRTEEHIDNPMGTGGADTVVKNTDPTAKDKNGNKIEIGAPKVPDAVVGDKGPAPVIDKDLAAQEQGSAWKGLQVENAKLYEISGSGLGNHIYNSVEATKKRWLHATDLGPTPDGRSEFGAGSHAVEDYFSHSNFVEVALNGYIEQALKSKGKKGENKDATKFADGVVSQNQKELGAPQTKQKYYVDTLFDATVKDPKSKDKTAQRAAVTTGSFGGDDTKVSIAHILLPGLPKLQHALLGAVDQMFGIKGEGHGWEQVKALLSSTPAGMAGARIMEGFSSAGMVEPVPDISLKWKSFPVSPGIFGKPWTVSLPAGIDHLSQSVPITDAVSYYMDVYNKAKGMIGLVEKYMAYAKKLMIPIDYLIDMINAEVEKIELAIKQAIKSQIVQGLISVVDSLSGRTAGEKEQQKKSGPAGDPKDPNSEFDKDMGDALHHFHEQVESIESKTSIEGRLKNGDLSEMPKAKVESLVGPVKQVQTETVDKDGKKVIRTYYESLKPLPPSHSEISKDHEPYSEHDKSGGDGDLVRHHPTGEEPGHEEGSPFFGLARTLALEACKHSDAQLQEVWKSRGSLLGDGNMYEYKSDADPTQSKKAHDDVLSESDRRAAEEKKRAKAEGSTFMQGDATGKEAELLKLPGALRLMNLVDEFVAHPADVSWWRPVMDAYVTQNAEVVYHSILRRNKTRADRDLK